MGGVGLGVENVAAARIMEREHRIETAAEGFRRRELDRVEPGPDPYPALSRNVPSSISAEIRAPVRTKAFCGMPAVLRAATVTASART
jgi:hypothetical protein